jgi:hypothetical protein
MTGWTLGIETTAHTLSLALWIAREHPILPLQIRYALTRVVFTQERLQTITKMYQAVYSLKYWRCTD